MRVDVTHRLRRFQLHVCIWFSPEFHKAIKVYLSIFIRQEKQLCCSNKQPPNPSVSTTNIDFSLTLHPLQINFGYVSLSLRYWIFQKRERKTWKTTIFKVKQLNSAHISLIKLLSGTFSPQEGAQQSPKAKPHVDGIGGYSPPLGIIFKIYTISCTTLIIQMRKLEFWESRM